MSDDEIDLEEYEYEEDEETQSIKNNYITEKLTTSEFLTKYEIANLIAIRSSQIERGSKIFVDYSDTDRSDQIAKKELLNRRVPLAIRRKVSSTKTGDYYEELPIPNASFPLFGYLSNEN